MDATGKTASDDRATRLRAVVDDFLLRRAKGDSQSAADVIAQHADLMPELAEALRTGTESASRPAASATHLHETLVLDPSVISNDKPNGSSNGNGHKTPDSLGQSVALKTPRPEPGVPNPSSHDSTLGRGLKVRCPSCRNYIETVVDGSWADITCSVCGSHFSLVDDAETTRAASAVTTVGHFDLIEQLGVGAFGTVWKARDRDLDRTVAVKVPRKGQLEPHEAEQFLREARAAAQLSHPNIVNVHEVGRDGDTIYIVSDIVRGVTLSDWMTKEPLTTTQATRVVGKIADALDHAHNKGIVHRDLKPGNVMLDADLEPHIMDFGLAKRDVGELTMTIEGRVLGTPAYMSPEQARGEGHHADRRSDIYSLGVMCFQMLTGELPFRGNTRMLILQILNEEPPSPRKINPTISRDLETIVLKCLEKEPAKRFATARELCDELRRVERGEPILSRPVGRIERTWRWARRFPAVASLLATVLVLLVTVAAVATTGYVRTQQALADLAEEKKDADAARQEAEKQKAEAVGLKAKADSFAATAESKRQAAEQAEKQERIARLQAEEFLYAQKIRNLCKAWESTDLPDDITPLLDDLKPQNPGDPDLRGWEWHYLYRQINQAFDHTLVHAPGVTVQTLAWSNDGKRIASGGLDGVVVIWNAETFEPIRRFAGHKGTVNRVAWTTDGKGLVSAGSDGTVKMWSADKDKPVYSLSLREDAAGVGVPDVCVSPDGTRIAAVYRLQDIRLFDAATGNVIKTLEIAQERSRDANTFGYQQQVGGLRRLAWSPNGAWIAAGWSDGKVQLWDVTTGAPSGEPRQSYMGQVTGMAWSSDSQRLVTVGGSVRVWDIGLRTERSYYGSVRQVLGVAWHPKQDLISVVGADGFARTWDLRPNSTEQNSDVGPLRRLTQLSESITWNPTGEFIAAGGRDGKIRIWRMALPQHDNRRDRGGRSITSLAWQPDGKQLVTAHGDNTIRFWDQATGARKNIWRLRGGQVRQLAWQADGSKVALLAGQGDQTGVFIRDASGKEIGELAGMHGVLRAWISGIVGGPISMPQGPAQYVVWRPDGKQLATTHYNNTIGIWNAETGRFVRALRGYASGTIDWSPDGQRIAGAGREQSIVIWNAEDAQEVMVLKGHPGYIRAVAYSPDGKHLATAGMDDTIRIWDSETGKQALRLIGHTNIIALKWEPTRGNRLMSLGTDNSLRLWDATTGLELLTLRPLQNISWSDGMTNTIDWSRDGHVASRGMEHSVRIWDTNQVIETIDVSKSANLAFEGNLVPTGHMWRYLDDGTDQGEAWREPEFDDSKWREGRPLFGYGDAGIVTTVDYGGDTRNKHITTYFRTAFNVPEGQKYNNLILGVVRDDGAAVYLNGTQIARTNLRPGARYSTVALRTVNNASEADMQYYAVDPALLRTGRNVLAAEVHQQSKSSTDLAFSAVLIANGLDTLVAMLESDEPILEEEAATRLEQLGEDAKSATPALVGYLRRNRGSGVDDAVLRGLRRIRGDAKLVVPALLEIAGSRNGFDYRLVETLKTMESYPSEARHMIPVLKRSLGDGTDAGAAAEKTLTTFAREDGSWLEEVLRQAAGQPEPYRAAWCRIVARLPGDRTALAPLIDELAAGDSAEIKLAAQAARLRTSNRVEAPLDLRPYLRIGRNDTAFGWSLTGGVLESPNTNRGPIVVDLVPPAEYSLVAEVEPRGDTRGAVIALAAGDRRVHVLIDFTGATALENVDDRSVTANPTRREGTFLARGKKSKVVCTVRANRIHVTVDDTTVIDYQGSFDRLSQNQNWELDNPNVLYIGNHGPLKFHSLTLEPAAEIK